MNLWFLLDETRRDEPRARAAAAGSESTDASAALRLSVARPMDPMIHLEHLALIQKMGSLAAFSTHQDR
jgi:hypothetical protein